MVGVLQMTEFMHHHIVHDVMRCDDDPPVVGDLILRETVKLRPTLPCEFLLSMRSLPSLFAEHVSEATSLYPSAELVPHALAR
jgi:hypothetical protein